MKIKRLLFWAIFSVILICLIVIVFYFMLRLLWLPTPLVMIAPAISGPVHVEGTDVFDNSGSKVQLRGLAVVPPIFMRDENVNYTEYIEKVKEWGANVIRFPVYYCVYQRENVDVWEEIDHVVELAKQNSLAIILDFHAIGYPPEETYHTEITGERIENLFYYTNEDLIYFWNEASKRYSDENTIIAYEIFNEVKWSEYDNDEVAWLKWKAFVEENLITPIRQNDPHKLVLISGLHYAFDLTWAAIYPIEDNNVAYKRTSYFETAPEIVENIPIIFAETDEVCLRHLESQGIGWVAHWFSPKWSPNLLVSYYKPSLAGQTVLSFLRGEGAPISAFELMALCLVIACLSLFPVRHIAVSQEKRPGKKRSGGAAEI
ncbi:MAG TPA: hypothetical protein ENG51_15925 [Deltaproteobacteria bacterium]|nr:MAG: hypothetical protein DRN83_02720 [Hadesarchaea archaeon]HDM77930.1 hypothetical protein [Deltaproteobacteria bacterium]